jgi:putative peptide zinc metalloprotease protein
LAVPYLLAMGSWLVVNLASIAPTRWAFWQSVAVLLLLAAQWLGPPLLAIRERRLRRAGELR